MDGFTRFVELKATPNAKSESFVSFLIELVGRYGLPHAVRTDQGPQFTALVVEALIHYLEVEHHLTLAYRPQANGIVERMNGEVNRHLRVLVNAIHRYEGWSSMLPWVQRIINTSYNSSIGTTPYRLLYGDINTTIHKGFIMEQSQNTNASTVEDYIQELNMNLKNLIKKSQDHQNAQVELRVNKIIPEDQIFHVGDYVFVEYPKKPPSKLIPKWRGPFIIISEVSANNIFTC
jgi:hypothetical protein